MATANQPSREGYSMGYGQAARDFMLRRTAARVAGFLLPHLRPGMRLLDIGCGPGSITLGLAAAVAPGTVVGIDIAEIQLTRARTLANEQGVANVTFEGGDACALAFEDAVFDVVFSRALLQHLNDPLRALREFRRVLRPGGVAALADPDWTSLQFEPSDALLDLFCALRVRHWQFNGGSPSYARRLRALLLEAGFAVTECSVPKAGFGTLAVARQAAQTMANEAETGRDTLVTEGWADTATVDAMGAALRAWGERPDAVLLLHQFEALGWVDAAPAVPVP